jgi:hypothetical protein
MRMMDNIQSIQVLSYNDLEYAQENKKDFSETEANIHHYCNKITIKIPENQFNKRFEIIEKGF